MRADARCNLIGQLRKVIEPPDKRLTAYLLGIRTGLERAGFKGNVRQHLLKTGLEILCGRHIVTPLVV